MNLSIREIEQISTEFRYYATELLNSNYNDVNFKLRNLLAYIDETKFLNDYMNIINKGKNARNPSEVKEYISGLDFYDAIDTGVNIEEQMSFVYSLLTLLNDRVIAIESLGRRYTSSNTLSDQVRMFNESISIILIDGINQYIVGLLRDMTKDLEANDIKEKERRDTKFDINFSNYKGGTGSTIITINSELKDVKNIVDINNTDKKDIEKVKKILLDINKNLDEKSSDIDENIKKVLENNTSELLELIEKGEVEKNAFKRGLENLELIAKAYPGLKFILNSIDKIKNFLF